MTTASDYNDGRDVYEAFWNDFIDGFRPFDLLVKSVMDKTNAPQRKAARKVSNDLFEGRDTSCKPIMCDPDEFPLSAEGAEGSVKRLMISVGELNGERVMQVIKLVPGNVREIIRRDGSTTLVQGADRWLTVGVVAERRFGEETIDRAMAVLRGYLATIRGQLREEGEGLSADFDDEVDDEAAAEAIGSVL